MYTEIRDPQFALSVNDIAASIRWPDASFKLDPLEAIVAAVVTFYEAFATPDRAILQHALKGIAF